MYAIINNFEYSDYPVFQKIFDTYEEAVNYNILKQLDIDSEDELCEYLLIEFTPIAVPTLPPRKVIWEPYTEPYTD